MSGFCLVEAQPTALCTVGTRARDWPTCCLCLVTLVGLKNTSFNVHTSNNAIVYTHSTPLLRPLLVKLRWARLFGLGDVDSLDTSRLQSCERQRSNPLSSSVDHEFADAHLDTARIRPLPRSR